MIKRALSFLCVLAVSEAANGGHSSKQPHLEAASAGKAACCKQFKLDSIGFGESYQGERLGSYTMYSMSNDGRYVYKQDNGINFMYFLPQSGIWMVGPDVGVDYGGILNREAGMCPESLSRDWEYWSDWSEEWEDDFSMECKCNGGPGPNPTEEPTIPPDHEPCTFGAVCYDCAIWSEVDGMRYCCANDCNSGTIDVSTDNGYVTCWCSHP